MWLAQFLIILQLTGIVMGSRVEFTGKTSTVITLNID